VEPLHAARTSADGRFEIGDVAAGPLTLVVRAPGYAQVLKRITMTTEGPAGGPVRVPLAPEAPYVGHVVDAGGRGVAGARVALMVADEFEGVLFGRRYSETDASGRFEITSPPPAEEFMVLIAARGHPTLFARGKRSSEPARFVLEGGARLRVEVREKATRAAVTGAMVVAMYGRAADGGEPQGLVTGRTDDRGEVELTARPGPLQMLMVRDERLGSLLYAPSREAGMLAAAGVARLDGPKEFEIAAGDNRLVLEAETGRMVVGRVSDPEDHPIAGARCTTIGALGTAGEAYTDAQGRYEVPAGLQGALVLVDAPGYVQRDLLRPGQSMPEADAGGRYHLDVVMDPSCTVTGRVVDGQGRPLAGAEVTLGGAGGMAAMFSFGRTSRSSTNAAGRYVLDGVRPGEGLRVRARLDEWVASETAEFPVQPRSVTSAPDLVLKSGSVVDVVVREPGGRPAGGARVEADVERADGMEEQVEWFGGGSRGFATLVADGEGRVSMRGVPEGTLTLTASRPDLCASRHVVKTGAGEGADARREVEIRLRRALPIRGRVLDPEGKPVAGARVESDPPEGGPTGEGPVPWYLPAVSATAKEDGTFTLDGLPDGEVSLRVTAEGFQSAELPVLGGRERVDVVLARVDPDVKRRIEELDAKIMEAAQRYQGAKDDGERKAALQELQRLSREKATLDGEGN